MLIEDGKGNGYKCEVNSANQLETRTVQQPRSEWECHNHGTAYVMYFSQAAANGGANECLGYMKNDSDDDLVIDELGIHITAANTVYVSKVTGTAGGSPTAVVPVNMNVGSGRTATGTFYKDDSMSGLTDAGRLVNCYLAANGYLVREPHSTILIQKNSAIGIFVVTQQSQTLNCSVLFHYESSHA
jgi:hypothetical protein